MRKNDSNALMTSAFHCFGKHMEVLLHQHMVEVFAEVVEFQCKLQLQGGRSMAPKEKHPLQLEDLLVPKQKLMCFLLLRDSHLHCRMKLREKGLIICPSAYRKGNTECRKVVTTMFK